MKLKIKFLLFASVVLVSLSSCLKDNYDPEEQAAKDEAAIVEFIAKNNIPAVKHSSGLYYHIINPGEGAAVTAASSVSVNYVGKLLNGNQFDRSTEVATFPLTGVIQGWTIGVPLIKVGGRIRLIVPSALGYGNRSPGGSIPANSVLDFTIDLLQAQ